MNQKIKLVLKYEQNIANYVKTSWSADWDSNEGLQLDIFVFETDTDKKHVKNSKNSSVVGRPDKYKRPYSDIYFHPVMLYFR